jgi:L-iditol 2-dehydrogenase
MRVGVYYSNSDVRVETRPKPAIGPGELLVKVMASGVCGSDVMEWYRKKKAPIVLGHEISGEIVEVGAGVSAYKRGDRVFVSHHVPCNTCKYCLAGNHTVCNTLHTTNFDPGGFSEYLRVPQLNVDRGVFVLPDEVSYAQGTFIEPLACVLRAQRKASAPIGSTVIVLGAGISGLLHIALAKALGAGRIIATDISEARLAHALNFGADHVFDARQDVPALLRQVNDGKAADLVLVCTGALSAFMQGILCVERGATFVVFAPTDPGITLPVPVNDFWRNGITITHAYGAGPLDIEQALTLIRFRRVLVDRMITHQFGLNQIQKAFDLVAGGGDSIKVIIEPQK